MYVHKRKNLQEKTNQQGDSVMGLMAEDNLNKQTTQGRNKAAAIFCKVGDISQQHKQTNSLLFDKSALGTKCGS